MRFADSLVDAIAGVGVDDLEHSMTHLFADRFRSGRRPHLVLMFLYQARVDENGERRSVLRRFPRLVAATEAVFARSCDARTMRPVNPAVAARRSMRPSWVLPFCMG